MSGRWGRRMRASAASAAVALCAGAFGAGCGGHYPQRAEPSARPAETCRAAESLPECEQRLQRYSARLDALVGPSPGDVAAHGARAPSPASPAPEPSAIEAEPSSQAPVLSAAPPSPQQDLGSVPMAEAYDAEEHATGAQAGPDCSSARDLRDRICELAEAICALAARSDAAPETIASCETSRTSCKDARERVAAACPD